MVAVVVVVVPSHIQPVVVGYYNYTSQAEGHWRSVAQRARGY